MRADVSHGPPRSSIRSETSKKFEWRDATIDTHLTNCCSLRPGHAPTVDGRRLQRTGAYSLETPRHQLRIGRRNTTLEAGDFGLTSHCVCKVPTWHERRKGLIAPHEGSYVRRRRSSSYTYESTYGPYGSDLPTTHPHPHHPWTRQLRLNARSLPSSVEPGRHLFERGPSSTHPRSRHYRGCWGGLSQRDHVHRDAGSGVPNPRSSIHCLNPWCPLVLLREGSVRADQICRSQSRQDECASGWSESAFGVSGIIITTGRCQSKDWRNGVWACRVRRLRAANPTNSRGALPVRIAADVCLHF